jgi:hypothetical protein
VSQIGDLLRCRRWSSTSTSSRTVRTAARIADRSGTTSVTGSPGGNGTGSWIGGGQCPHSGHRSISSPSS